MQERYLGDDHDFIKFGILRALSKAAPSLRLGVHWYLTDPHEVDDPKNRDGEFRGHSSPEAWQLAIDAELSEKLARYHDREKRRLSDFENSEILPSGTLYFSEPVPVGRSARIEWHRRAKVALAGADIILFDPDNGFEPKKRITQKHAMFSEAADFLKSEKLLMAYQSSGRKTAAERIAYVSKGLNVSKAPVTLRIRAAAMMLFHFFIPTKYENLIPTLHEISNRTPKFADSRRIEIVL